MTNSQSAQSVPKIISNITTVMEFAPAAKKDPDQLADMLSSAAEFRVAVRMLRGMEPYATQDEIDDVKVDAPADDQVASARKMLGDVRDLFKTLDVSGFDDQHNLALESMLVASDEMASNIRSLAS